MMGRMRGWLAILLLGSVYGQTGSEVIARRCLGCHGAAKMSGLDLRDAAGLARGGKRGAAVVAGNAAESLLYRAVRGEGELKMPPGKERLEDNEIEAQQKRIEAGAKEGTGEGGGEK